MTNDLTPLGSATDKDQMFSTREVPWMKLGRLVDEPVTAAEAAKLAGIDFDVVQRPVYFRTSGQNGVYKRIDTRMANVREDTGDWLSIVSKGYPIVQYSEAFDFMDAVSPHYVAAGGLRKFRQAFMVVKPDVEALQNLPDPHELYLTLRTSHDCSRAVEAQLMPLRGRCMNQLTLQSFRSGVKHRWSVTHSGDVKTKLAAAQVSIKNVGAYGVAYAENVERLLEVKVTDEIARTTLLHVLPDRPKRDEAIEAILNGWQLKDEVGFRDTGWGLVNAVSEYFEWARVGGSPESRFLAALEGQTHKAINKTAARLLTRA